MNPIIGKQVFTEGLALLHKTEIPWWVSSGTVIGIVREGLSDEWLTHDTDWDVSIWGGAIEHALLRRMFLEAGFTVFREYSLRGVPVQLCFEKDGILFDLYFWRSSEKESDLLVCDCEHGQMIKLKRFAENRYLREGIYMPGPVREYLFWRYGPHWHVPQKSKGAWEIEAPHLRKDCHRL